MLTKPPFFPAARPRKAAKSGYSTDSTTYGFNGILTDGAGGSAQTDLSNLVGLGLTARLLAEERRKIEPKAVTFPGVGQPSSTVERPTKVRGEEELGSKRNPGER